MITPWDFGLLYLTLLLAVGVPVMYVAYNLTKIAEASRRHNELVNEANDMVASNIQFTQALAEEMQTAQREHFDVVREQLKDYK